MIGADGARSVVRRRLGIGVSETEDLLEALSVLHAPLWEVVGRHRYGIYVTDVPAPGVPPRGPGRPLALRLQLGSSIRTRGRSQ